MKAFKIILATVILTAGAMTVTSCKSCAKRVEAEKAATEQAVEKVAEKVIPSVVAMAVVPAVHTNVPEKIDVQITNNTDVTAQFGAEFMVERRNGDVWEMVPGTDKFPVPMVLHTLKPGETQTYVFHLRPDTVTYGKGIFRLSKNILLNNENKEVIFAEFEIQ